MAEGDKAEEEMEIQMQIDRGRERERDSREACQPQPTLLDRLLMAFLRFIEEIVSPRRHFGQFGSLLKVKCVKMAN